MFINGKKNGEGTLYDEKGYKIYKGIFENGMSKGLIYDKKIYNYSYFII